MDIPRFNQSFLTRREGLSVLLLESGDAAAAAASFNAAGIAASDALRFEREGTRPDGSKVKVGFSVAFARDRYAPDIGFGVCQQHFPENFWNPAFQRHANTVSGIAGAVLVAENPSDLHIFLSAFTGERELRATSSGITAPTPRGDIKVMDPAAFENHFGVAAPDIESLQGLLRDLRGPGKKEMSTRTTIVLGTVFEKPGFTPVEPD